LQIANDTARLNVKKSILALEEAIASKDEASITAATNKLNADLKVLGALTGQSIKLSDIKSILESLKPVDLVNLGNLDAAIAKMLELIRLQGIKPPSSGGGGGGGNPALPPSSMQPRSIGEINKAVEELGLNTQIQPNLREYTPNQGMISGISPNGREYNFSVTVNTGIGDPNAIAEAIDQVLIDAVSRGTLRGGATLA
jgi:hypothetical protein